MKRQQSKHEHSIGRIIFATLFSFFLVEIVLLIIQTPGLLKFKHMLSLFRLIMSCLILYIGIAFIYLFFLLLIIFINKIFRLRLTGRATAIITLVLGPFFLIIHQTLQKLILGDFISQGSALFFLPSAITFVLLIIALYIFSLIRDKQDMPPEFIKVFFSYPRIVLTAGFLFILFALFLGSRSNVLGIFNADEERNMEMEKHLDHIQSAKPEAPNFIVLTIECFRSDEFNSENCPFLWELAQDNIYFSRYYVVSAATRPSVTSFFTSLYPIQHGCYNLALDSAMNNNISTFKVSEDVDSIPERFQQEGYHTIMVTSNNICMDPAYGFENVYYKFDAINPYQFAFPSFELFYGFQFLRRYLRHSRLFKFVVFSPEHSTVYFDARRLNRTIMREFPLNHDRPFFLYVHYIEPHSPYYYHPYKPMQLNIYSPRNVNKMLGAYRSEIRAADMAISDIFNFFNKLGLLDNTYIFITGDHGEEFHDHMKWGHGKQLFPETIHVPGILVLPGDKRYSKRVDNVVENIDIPVTFAELAGITPAESWQGESLVPLFDEEATSASNNQKEGVKEIALSQFDDGYTFKASAIMGKYQIIFIGWPKIKETLLFDLSDDQHAKENMAGHEVELEVVLTELLHNALMRLEGSSQKYQGKAQEIVDKEQLERLRSLGYIR